MTLWESYSGSQDGSRVSVISSQVSLFVALPHNFNTLNNYSYYIFAHYFIKRNLDYYLLFELSKISLIILIKFFKDFIEIFFN